ncbi:hypothetical protein LEN26_003881 [Aphanomyces euteiches]|nr:hypothetical protein LEN26_003881 [Aphanomyces euteiches]KAH9188418.1 hypothetical protein AeNC1_009601 [Aphanomyces euteiches]
MEVIEVVPFAASRVQELREIHSASGYEAYESNRQTKRRKDYHLRRRTNAYSSRKFPVRLRLKTQQKGKVQTGARCRKHRRREMLNKKDDRLATHRWLVKRMKMEKMDGIFVPLHRLDKSISAALVAPCTVCDTSYLDVLELVGPKDDILEVLHACMDEIMSDEVLAGAIEGHYVLYHADAFPMQAIGPVRILCHATNESNIQVWTWIHPSMLEAVRSNFAALSTPTIHIQQRSLCRFEVRGKECGLVMGKIFQDHSTLVWNTPSVETNKIQSWHFQDPRAKQRPSASSTESLLDPPPSNAPTTAVCPTTKEDFGATEPPLKVLNDRFAALLKWSNGQKANYSHHFPKKTGSTQSPPASNAADNHTTEPLLWTATPTPFVKDHVVNSASSADAITLPSFPSLTVQVENGWDIIFWPEYAPMLLKHAVFAGASAIGILERDALRTQKNLLNFPRDFPDAEAGRAFWRKQKQAGEQKLQATPKAKRVAYEALQVSAPFAPDWIVLFPETNDFCVLRGATYMEPFPFYRPETKAALSSVPVAIPTLICVQLVLPRRGNIDTNAMICFPKEDDVKAFQASKEWQGDIELTAKQAKRQPNYTTRSTIGFVTSVVVMHGKYQATGFCHCDALQQLFLQYSAIAPGLVVIRNPTSRQYRPAILSVL